MFELNTSGFSLLSRPSYPGPPRGGSSPSRDAQTSLTPDPSRTGARNSVHENSLQKRPDSPQRADQKLYLSHLADFTLTVMVEEQVQSRGSPFRSYQILFRAGVTEALPVHKHVLT